MKSIFLVKYSPYGECEIIFIRKLWNIAPLSQCEIKFAHVRTANISHLQSKYFTAKLFHLPKGQISLKKALAFASAFFWLPLLGKNKTKYIPRTNLALNGKQQQLRYWKIVDIIAKRIFSRSLLFSMLSTPRLYPPPEAARCFVQLQPAAQSAQIVRLNSTRKAKEKDPKRWSFSLCS